MKKRSIPNSDDLAELIDGLLNKPHTMPTSENNIKMAFQEFVSNYPDVIYFPLWQCIYTDDKSSEQIYLEIQEASETFTIPRKKNINQTQGRGGNRGLVPCNLYTFG